MELTWYPPFVRCSRLAVLLGLFVAVSVFSIDAQTIVSPLQKEGAEHKKQADAFFESLHIVPPGMNWRIVNEVVRNARTNRMRMSKGERALADTPRIGGDWREVGSNNQAGRIVSVDLDEQTGRVWVGGDGGTVWLGDTSGSKWTILNETQRINYPRLIKNVKLSDGTERLVVVSSSPRAYMLNENDTLFIEATGLADIQRWGSFARAISCERDGRLEILCAGVEWDFGAAWRSVEVIYRSIDSGATYQRLLFVEGIRSMWTDGYDNVLVVHNDTLSALSSDGSLTKVSELPYFENIRSSLLAGSELYHLMLAIKAVDSTRFYVSDDDGTTWERRGAVNFGPFEQRSFCQTAGDGATWIYGGVDVHRSSDDGYTWKAINTWGEYYADPLNKLHADIPSLSSFATIDGRGLTFLCTDGGMYTSRDDAATVKNISLSGLNVSQYYGSYTSRDNVDVVSAGAQDQGYQRSTVEVSNAPRDFRQMISGDYANLVSGDDGHSIFCVYPGFTLFIPDAELGWGAIGLEFPHTNHMWLPPLAAHRSNPNEVFLGGGTRSAGAFVYRYYRDAGVLLIDSLPFNFGEASADVRITAIGISQADPSHWYVVTTLNTVWFSEDGGLSWYMYARPPGLDGHYFAGNAMALDPRDPRRMYLGGSGYGGPAAYVTHNAGESFTGLPGLPPCLVLGLAISDDGRLLAAATDIGAFVYDTTLHVWTDITELGAPDQTYWHVDWVPPLGLFRFSTYGRGLWDFTPELPTSVADFHANPTKVNIRGVLRNNTAEVLVESAVEISGTFIWYDVAGRRLKTEYIVMNAGVSRHDIPFDAKTASMVVLIQTNGDVAATALPAAR